MNIGIVTVFDSNNLGSFLQALGMQELVKQNGGTPYIIKTRSNFTTFCLFMGYNNAPSARSLKSFILFVLRNIKNARSSVLKYKKYRTYRKDWKCFENIISTKKANKLNLDVILFGSDEIWNMNQPAFINPLIYGIGLNANKKIAYAISIGNATENTIKNQPNLLKAIRDFDSILTRDDYTKMTLGSCGAITNEHICDPTLQVDIRKYMNKSISDANFQSNYIAVYSYAVNDIHKQWIQNFAQENNLRIIAISLPLDWADGFINCSPLEFGHYLNNAAFVYTNTFHGTIFSALYHKNFVSYAKLPKVIEVLDLLELQTNRIYDTDSYESFRSKLLSSIDFHNMEEKIIDVREQSIKLYQKHVKGDNNANL